jgi:hypothetical protein
MSAQSFSPLAQIYNNPVVVDDNRMMEDLSNAGNSTPLPVISYGPATRRRFTSTQRRPVELHDHADSTQFKRFPTIPSTNYNVSPPEHGVLRSRSQDRNPKTRPSTALQSKTSHISLQSKSSTHVSNAELQESSFLQRLDAIERSQANIESLLTQISQNISSNRS